MKKNIIIITVITIIFSSCGITRKDNIKKYNNSFKNIIFKKSNLIWKIDLSTSDENKYGKRDLSAPIIIDENILIYANAKKIYQVNYNNGVIISKKKVSYSIMSPIVKVDENLIFFASDGMIHLVDNKFNKIWNYKLDFEKVVGSFHISESIFFKTSKDKIFSLKKNGDLNWVTESHLAEFMPLLTDNKLLISEKYLFTGFTNGRFTIIDKENGKTIFEKTLSTNENFNDIIAPLTKKDSIIYIPSFAKGIIAFDEVNKEMLWSTELSTISSIFTSKYGNFYLNDKYLIKFNIKDGKILKRYNFIPNRVVSSTLLKDRYIVITSSKDGITMLDLLKKSSFTINISSGVSNKPIFIGNDMILLSNNGILYRIKMFLNL